MADGVSTNPQFLIDEDAGPEAREALMGLEASIGQDPVLAAEILRLYGEAPTIVNRLSELLENDSDKLKVLGAVALVLTTEADHKLTFDDSTQAAVVSHPRYDPKASNLRRRAHRLEVAAQRTSSSEAA